MKSALNYLLISVLVILCGCSRQKLFTDKEYLSLIETSFNERKQLASGRAETLFSVFNNSLSDDQSNALKFLYAFMPLNDLADYDGAFFLANVDKALDTRVSTTFGKTIPEDIFLHYVLPCRVNNENLDSFRIVYYQEIQNRIKGMDLEEAALEINHWCHEKVNYQAADIRTSAPMSTILSARGRCGEESTFTVAALRTAGIPARQVYTPRWAHNDDNHAWVEIWIDGNWFYMGACEPEPVLDRGWFTEPARRAMLIHTKSFGAPDGRENTVNKFKLFSEVNNTSKYAVTKRIFVKVLDKNGLPSQKSTVEYRLYNYAEFYPIATVQTDSTGISQFETGLGDLLIWATDGNRFDFKKISVSETDTLVLKLMLDGSEVSYSDLDLDVPVVRKPLQGPPSELSAANSKRVEAENLMIRNYIESWISIDEIDSLAAEYAADTIRLRAIFERSMGNYREINNFLSLTPDSLMPLALDLLETAADKDLRDTKSSVLAGHLKAGEFGALYNGIAGYRFYLDYVLNPRVSNEILTDWRTWIPVNLPADVLLKAKTDPTEIVRFLDENIKVDDEQNYYRTPISPRGVLELKVSDSDSRAICFVAVCRALGIPARLEPGSNLPQFFSNNAWSDVYFGDQVKPLVARGFIKLKSKDTSPVPEYYKHFTLARLENGRYITLEYDYNKKISAFTEELALLPGSYMLVTGNRLNDGRILSSLEFFRLNENEHKSLEVTIRKDLSAKKIIGKIDLEHFTGLIRNNPGFTKRDTAKGLVILWIEPQKEPTRHVFNDLPLLKQELDSWGGSFIFLTLDEKSLQILKPESLKGLPVNSFFAVDTNGEILNKTGLDEAEGTSFPFVILSDSKGNVSFTSSGYRIGIGENILKSVK